MTNDLESWKRSVRATLFDMASQDFGYPIGIHEVPEGASEIPAGVPPALVPLYTAMDGLSLPDVWNGYFIDSAQRMVSAAERGGPTLIEGDPPRRIHVFGSDGGGALFAIDLDHESIYYLPSGSVSKDGVWLANPYEPANKVADNVMEFLERLRSDIEAYVRLDENHTYMIR